MASKPPKDSPTKAKLKKHIISLNDGSRLDFSESYLENLSTSRLRHILLYTMTMRTKKPTSPDTTAKPTSLGTYK